MGNSTALNTSSRGLVHWGEVVFAQYKKTFWYMQIVALLAACEGYAFSHRGSGALTFFWVAQVSAVVGSAWAVRIKRKLERML